VNTQDSCLFQSFPFPVITRAIEVISTFFLPSNCWYFLNISTLKISSQTKTKIRTCEVYKGHRHAFDEFTCCKTRPAVLFSLCWTCSHDMPRAAPPFMIEQSRVMLEPGSSVI